MNESAGTPNDYCANLPSCQQPCAAAPEALQARFQPKGKNASEDSLRGPAWPQRKDLWHAPAFAIGPTAIEKKPQADCRTRKTSNTPGPLSGPFFCSQKRVFSFAIFCIIRATPP